jgi:hypothetical protein
VCARRPDGRAHRFAADPRCWADVSEGARIAEVTSGGRDARNPDPERVGLKARGIRALLAEWDPLGVTKSDGSSDEYECLVWPLTRLLDREASAEQVASFLSSELAGHFGVDGQTGEPGQFASRLIAWFRASARNSRG